MLRQEQTKLWSSSWFDHHRKVLTIHVLLARPQHFIIMSKVAKSHSAGSHSKSTPRSHEILELRSSQTCNWARTLSGSALQEPRNVFCPDTTPHGLQHRLRRNLAQAILRQKRPRRHTWSWLVVYAYTLKLFSTMMPSGSTLVPFPGQLCDAHHKRDVENLPKRTRAAAHDAAGEDGIHVHEEHGQCKRCRKHRRSN